MKTATLSWRLVGNYTDEETITVLGQKFDGAGIYQGGGFTNPLAGNTSPKLNFRLSTTYDTGPAYISALALPGHRKAVKY